MSTPSRWSLCRQAYGYILEGLPRRIHSKCTFQGDAECINAIDDFARRYALLRGTASRAEISVVIPIHFKESLVALACNLNSLLDNQQVPPTEIIAVINGKATTEALQHNVLTTFCNRIGLKVFCISYVDIEMYAAIKRPQNIFVPKQCGLDHAQGSIVLHADVDCLYSPYWIKSYQECFVLHPDLLAAYGPVYYDTVSNALVARCMTAISTLVKAAKILLDFPPLAGHNHAVKTSIRDLVPNIYGSLTVDCQIITGKLLHASSPGLSMRDIVTYAPGALISTLFPKRTSSPAKALQWIFEAAVRNVSNYLLHKRSVKKG